MNFTYPTDIKESEPAIPVVEKEPALFSPYMEEKKAELFVSDEEEPLQFPFNLNKESIEEKEEEKSDVNLMAGPVFAPLVPTIQTFTFPILAASLPKELQLLITPLPAVIESSFKSGITQTKIVIELPSSENVEIVIDQYDTAPTAFHISFYGSEQTGSLISQKQSTLIQTLQTALPNFSFAISPPFHGTPSFSLPKREEKGYLPVKRQKEKK